MQPFFIFFHKIIWSIQKHSLSLQSKKKTITFNNIRNMKRELVETRLFTDDYSDKIYSYEDYKSFCEDMEIEVFSENSDQYWDWVRDQEEFWWEELMDALEIRCDFPCIITGSCGTWRGRREICPTYMDNVKDAIKKCCTTLIM